MFLLCLRIDAIRSNVTVMRRRKRAHFWVYSVCTERILRDLGCCSIPNDQVNRFFTTRIGIFLYIKTFHYYYVALLCSRSSIKRVNWLVTIKIKRLTSYHHRADPDVSPAIMNGCTFNGALFLELHTLSGKTLGKWPVNCTAPKSTCHQKFSNFITDKILLLPYLDWNGVILTFKRGKISKEVTLPNPTIPLPKPNTY